VIELAQTAVLHTIAEISATFVGFSLVAGVLGAGPADRHRFFSIQDVAEIGLTCLAGALLPSALHALDLSADTIWRIASATLSVAWLTGSLIGLRRFWPARLQASRLLIFSPLASVVGNVLLLWNLISPALASGRYVWALLLYLAVAGISFIAAVFHGRQTPAA
jgi:hypothetical protein